jgi:hypothetical protein
MCWNMAELYPRQVNQFVGSCRPLSFIVQLQSATFLNLNCNYANNTSRTNYSFVVYTTSEKCFYMLLFLGKSVYLFLWYTTPCLNPSNPKSIVATTYNFIVCLSQMSKAYLFTNTQSIFRTGPRPCKDFRSYEPE